MDAPYLPALQMTTLGVVLDVLLGAVENAVVGDLPQAYYQDLGSSSGARCMYRYITMLSF